MKTDTRIPNSYLLYPTSIPREETTAEENDFNFNTQSPLRFSYPPKEFTSRQFQSRITEELNRIDRQYPLRELSLSSDRNQDMY